MTDRDRIAEIIRNARMFANPLSQVGYAEADALLANGVIVPPCRVGDTVYEIQPIRQKVQSYKITTLKWSGRYWWFTWILKDHKGIYGNVEGFCSHQIGKTVFLTKEEAEEKLKEMGK